MAAERSLRLRHNNAIKKTNMRAAEDAPTPMPIFVGSSSCGVTIGLVALLECSVGDVVEFAPAGKDVEVTASTVTGGVGSTFTPIPEQAEDPKKSINSETTYA